MSHDDIPSLNSATTMLGDGVSPKRPRIDEPSLGSAPTMAPGGPGAVPAASSLGRIDQYDLVRKLGGGGFGVVYLARDTVSGVEVALKTLHPLLKANAEEMERLREKFALVSRLSHPNIATALVLHPVREVAIADDEARRELRLFPGDSVMVMRYAPGVTLSKWRRQFPGGKVPLDQTLEIGRQIASALDYAHGEKIVHRDIKPSNVMVETLPPEASQPSRSTANHRVRILDFGLAAEIRSSMSRVSTETGDTSGTRPYMAPEQWLGKKQDGRTDQYALACVLYELLAGEPPFAGVFETGDPIIMRTAVERDMPDEIDYIPSAVNAALLKALAKNPKERFGSCAEFVEAVSQEKDLSHTEALRQGGSNTGGTPSLATSAAPSWERGHPARGTSDSSAAALESDVLRRKLALSRDLKAIPDAIRTDPEFSKFVSSAEDELAVAEEACKFGRFATAAESLNCVKSEVDALGKAREAREEAERKAKEEAERKAREEVERKAKEEAERKAKEEAERKAHEEAERKAKKEAERKAMEEFVRMAREKAAQRAREEAEHMAKEAAERQAREKEAKAKEIASHAWKVAGGSKDNKYAILRVLIFIAALIGIGLIYSNLAEDTSSLTRPQPIVATGTQGQSQQFGTLGTSHTSGERKVVRVGSQKIALRWCPPGTFTMGSPASEKGRYYDETQHRVTLTRGFWMGETEVTQGLWKEVMRSNPSYNKSGDDYPVEQVSWNDCQEFIEKLNARSDVKPTGLRFGLPTEAQWEHACRAGTTGTYGGTGRLDDMGWYDGNSGGKTHPVGQKEPNAWNLRDMHGNVYEWCADWYGNYPTAVVTDHTGPASGDSRVLRGGGYWRTPQDCRSARRDRFVPGARFRNYGLRLLAFQDGR